MTHRASTPSVIVVALLALSTVSTVVDGQALEGSSEVTLDGNRSETVPLSQNGSSTFEANLKYSASGVTCAGAVVEVRFAADTPDGLSLAVEPATRQFVLTGTYSQNSPAGTYQASSSVKIQLSAEPGNEPRSVPASLTANTSAVEPPDCIPRLPATSDAAQWEVHIPAAPSGPADVGPAGGGDRNGASMVGAAWLVLIPLVAGLLVKRAQ